MGLRDIGSDRPVTAVPPAVCVTPVRGRGVKCGADYAARRAFRERESGGEGRRSSTGRRSGVDASVKAVSELELVRELNGPTPDMALERRTYKYERFPVGRPVHLDKAALAMPAATAAGAGACEADPHILHVEQGVVGLYKYIAEDPIRRPRAHLAFISDGRWWLAVRG